MIQATDGNFYGVTNTGGANNLGTVYRMTPAGMFTTLYSFCAQVDSKTGYCLDGQNPVGGLVQTPNRKLYGTTSAGGTSNDGTVFRLLLFPGAGADSVANGAQTDYQGQGHADYTVWRPATGYWYSNGGDGTFSTKPRGAPTDRPVVGDFDGDGKSDLAVWRPSNGYWYVIQSSDGQQVTRQWGEGSDVPIASRPST